MATISSNAAANRVVSLNGLGPARSPGHRILNECRDQLISKLCLWLRDIAAPVSEELFVLADSTRERLLQTRYLDLRAEIEKDWPHLIETFRRLLSEEAERCQNKGNESQANGPSALEIPDFAGLELIDDEDLSEHIVIREFAAQLCESCDEELYTLDRRVAVLLGHEELPENANPLAPAVICEALSDACATMGSDPQQRLILLRRLERHLHLGLPPIYKEINAYLIERGILPDLKRNYRKTTSAKGTSSASTSPTVQATTSAGTSTAATVPEGILDALQRLAQARTSQMQMPGGGILGSAAIPPGNTFGALFGSEPGQSGVMIDAATVNQLLLASLNEMQHAPIGETSGPIVNQVRIVRDSESAKQVSGLEAVTIDIVAMLFDFIFEDGHIPVAIKALISRLQIPVLKVVMLDPGFFADRQHPARRFLSSISGISVRWGTSVDETDPLYKKLAELVDRIQAEFENDVEVFGTALTELEAFVNERESEEDNTALTAANIVIQREQEAEGWERAQRAVKAFREENTLPALLDSFFTEHWVGVLQAIAAKDEDEAAWSSAKQVMADLSWSIEPKKAPADRLKLVGLLPQLLGQLNKGLDSITIGPAQRSAFLDALMKLHSAALKGEAPAPEAAPVAEVAAPTPSTDASEEGDLLVTRSVDNGVEVEEVILVGASPIWRADDREISYQVSELKRGDWVEFCDEDGNTSRERLNWISPQRGILLFSNHRSSKAISIAPDALARQIRDGKAAIICEEQIFERALSGALESISAS